MKANCALEPWLDSAQVIDYLHASSGIELTPAELLKLFDPEHHVAYLDCSFANVRPPRQQMFVRRVKGAGHGELLQLDKLRLCASGASGQPVLSVGGEVVVLGSAWVYSRAGGRPTLEEGLWQIDLGGLYRPLQFKPADVEHLAARISESQRSHLVRRAAR